MEATLKSLALGRKETDLASNGRSEPSITLAVRILDQFGLDHSAARRWEGMKAGNVTNHEFAEVK
jgi:hypothetical protein